MNKFVTLATAMMSACALAQPVINSNHVSQHFNAELYFAEMPSGFSAGPAGANRTWNFNSIGNGFFLGTQQAVPVAGTPYASEFPQANYCYTMQSIFSDLPVYYYHSLTPSKYEIFALGYAGATGEGENFIQNPRTYIVFPYTYGTVFTDTFQTTEDPESVSMTATYDAYGTLTMPFGSFQNVVRQKIEINGTVDYVWFNVNPFYPILQTSFEDEIVGFIQDNTVLGVDDRNLSNAPVVFPNPVGDVLDVLVPTGFGSTTVSVTDLSGKTIISGDFNGSEIRMDAGKLNSGVYLVRIANESGSYVTKIIKQ